MSRRAVLVVLGTVGMIVFVLVGIRLATRPDAGPTYEIVGIERIGDFPADGTTGQALDVFGPPSRRQHHGRGCTLEWSDRGLTMTLAFEGNPEDPCAPTGWHSSTTVTDLRWSTDEGLKIGDAEARARELYPDFAIDGNGLATLLMRDVNGLLLPGLLATIKNGKVASLILRGPPRAF